MKQFQVVKNEIDQSRVVSFSSNEALVSGAIKVRIEKFAITSNNITYAVAGDKLGYWQFFPPLSSDTDSSMKSDKDYGMIPVWGFAAVIETNCDQVKIGDRYFGYFPPADILIMKPSNVSEHSFIEDSEHRSHLPVAYNIYRKIVHPSTFSTADITQYENERMLLYPLHVTSYALFDFFEEHNWFNAEQVILLSASSKTSTGLAYGIKHKKSELTQIGVTSAKNVSAVKGLEVYDLVLDYSSLDKINNSKPTVIIDMSGNSEVISVLHQNLQDNMKFCSKVGITHKDSFRDDLFYIKDRTKMFFAPSQIQKKIKENGMQTFDLDCTQYLTHSYGQSRSWLRIEELNGLEGLQDVFIDICEGRIVPTKGLIVKLP